MSDNKKLSAIEVIKTASNGLRGSINESLKDEITGAIREDDKALIKFHGMYEQDDRDRREERAEKKLDRLYSFMIRLRLPGGLISAKQWIAAHHIAGQYSTGVIKITTRQTIQLHGLLKQNIRPTIQAFNQAALHSIATCGDINRNVTCASHPKQSEAHAAIFSYAEKINALLMPTTKAYYEIWIDQDKIVEEKAEEDPLYQAHYLPRKFKIGIAIPPNNDVDVFTNDLGLIAIVEDGKLQGFNLAVGGGMSSTHGNPDTYARLATVIGFVDTEEKILKAVYEIVSVQRDFGNRSDRKLARLKYTVDNMGVEIFKAKVEERAGFKFDEARQYKFEERSDYFGWHQGTNGLWYYTIFVENGRIADDEKLSLKTALLEVALTDKSNFLFTANQNIIIGDVAGKDKEAVEAILQEFKITRHTEASSKIRKNAIACVALPTCPLALAEGQRYMPQLIDKIEPLLLAHGLEKENIIVRMTGCPNGCARPGAAEIAFVGTSAGHYNLQLGGDHQGERLNRIYKHGLNENEILAELDQLFASFKTDRLPQERLGDYVMRKEWV